MIEERATQTDTTQTGGDDVPGAGESTAQEIGGRKGPEPTRFGDWEKNGRCIDF